MNQVRPIAKKATIKTKDDEAEQSNMKTLALTNAS